MEEPLPPVEPLGLFIFVFVVAGAVLFLIYACGKPTPPPPPETAESRAASARFRLVEQTRISVLTAEDAAEDKIKELSLYCQYPAPCRAVLIYLIEYRKAADNIWRRIPSLSDEDIKAVQREAHTVIRAAQ